MDRRGRGRGFDTPPGVPLRWIPPRRPIRTTEGVCGTQPPAAGEQAEMQDAEESTEEQQTDQYDATLEDVKQTKMLLTAKGLPWEIVNIIMDKAEYWACSETSVDYSQNTGRVKWVSGGTPTEDSFMLRCPPIGLTKWAPPASDTPEYELWWDKAARPKLVAEHDEAPVPSLEDKQHNNQDSNPKTPAEASPAALDGPFARQVYFDKDTLEKLTDIPVPTLENPVRKIVFDIVSGDQGHGGYEAGARANAPYDNSHTWFDAGLDRFDKSVPHPGGIKEDDITNRIHPSMIRPVWPRSQAADSNNNNDAFDNIRRPMNQPQDPIVYYHNLHPDRKHVIQFNKRAHREPQHHHVEWSWLDGSVSGDEDLGFVGHAPDGNGDFVRSLRLGDMITIWGRARYGGWINNVRYIDVKIYYAA